MQGLTKDVATPNFPPSSVTAKVEAGRWKRNEEYWGIIKRGTVGAFLGQAGGAGLGLIVHVVIARLLGPAAYGSYGLALTWVSFLCVFALVGQTTSVVRVIPRYIHNCQWELLRGLRRWAVITVFAAAVGFALVGTLVVYIFQRQIGQELKFTLLAAFVLLPILAQLQLNGSLHRSLKRATSSVAFNGIMRPILLLGLVLVITLLFHKKLTAPLTMYASCLAVVGSLAASNFFLRKAWPFEAKRVAPRYDARGWLTLGGHLFLYALVGIVLSRVDVLLLGTLSGSEDVGPYYAAVQLATIVSYGLNAVGTILGPLIAERYAAGDHVEVELLVRRAAKLTFAITVSAAIAIAICGSWVLELFGKGFGIGYLPLLVIVLGQCINAATGSTGDLMMMTHYEKYAPIFFGSGALLNVALGLLLIPRFGMLGAAIATATSVAAWNIAAVIFIIRRLRINPTILPLSLIRIAF